MKKLFLLVIFVLSVHVAFANEANQRKLSEQIFQVIGSENQMKDMFERVKSLQITQIQKIAKQSNVPEPKNLIENMNGIFEKNLDWNDFKGKYIDMYVHVFTEDELKGILNFYKSPIGQKYIERTPDVMKKSANIYREMMQKIVPEVTKMVAELKNQAIK